MSTHPRQSPKRAILFILAILLASGIVAVPVLHIGVARIAGTVTGPPGIRHTRVLLLQGPQVRLLVEMGVVVPGSELALKRDNSSISTTAAADGTFAFSGVRSQDSVVVGLAEFEDGHVCRTAPVDVDPLLGSYRVELTVASEPCWQPAASAKR